MTIFHAVIFIASLSSPASDAVNADFAVVWGLHKNSAARENVVCGSHQIEYVSNFHVKRVLGGSVATPEISFRHCWEWEGPPFSASKMEHGQFTYTPHTDWLIFLDASKPDCWVDYYSAQIYFDTASKPYVCDLPLSLERLNKRDAKSSSCLDYGKHHKRQKVRGYYLYSIRGISNSFKPIPQD